MKKEELLALEEIYENSLQTKKEMEEELQKCLNRKEEIEVFLTSIKESQDFDEKIFSPRTVEDIHRDKIEESNKEIRQIETEIHSHYNKINNLSLQIESLQKIITNAYLKHKSLRILEVQEKERSRIARELHDSSLQNLTHLIHTIELSCLFIDQDPIRAKLELSSCSQNLKKIIDEIRDTIFNLRPMTFDDLGFRECIENYITNLKVQFKDCEILYSIEDIKFKEEYNGQEEYSLFLVTTYRVLQEALLNALKHSHADKVELYVKNMDDKILVQIIDNGNGFLVDEVIKNKEKHFGISIMQERIYLLNGNIDIDSKLNEGTNIKIVIPKL